jgi:hypothetical protein
MTQRPLKSSLARVQPKTLRSSNHALHGVQHALRTM